MLVLDNNAMSIVQGPRTLASIDLTNFFIPLAKYNLQDITLAAGETITIDPCNIGSDTGEVQFLALIVTYPQYDVSAAAVPSDDMYLNYYYPASGQAYNVGKILVLSGSTQPGKGWDLEGSPGGFVLTNPHSNFDVEVQVLMFN